MTGAGRGPSKGKRTVEEDAAKRAAGKKARAAGAAADREAKLDKERTVEVVEDELRRVVDALLGLTDFIRGGVIPGEEEQYAELQTAQDKLKDELRRKREERTKALAPRVEFTKRAVDDALRPLLEELKSADRLGPTETKLEAVRKQYEARIIELTEVAKRRGLTERQRARQTELRRAAQRPAKERLQKLQEDAEKGTLTPADAVTLKRFEAKNWLTVQEEEELTKLEDGDGLTSGETEELAQLRVGSARIEPAKRKARKDLKERKEKASAAQGRQKALADFEDPTKHLLKDDKENWWVKDGRRQWRKLRRRGKLAVARKRAGLPADADRPPVQEAPIEPSSLAGSSDAQWERELNEQMEAAGLRAIEALLREKGEEAQRLREAGYSGSDSDDAGVDG